MSLIVPIFDIEQELLERCLHSLLGQNYEQIEILLVDDGSQVALAEWMDAFAARCDRMSVLHQANGGVSAARNAGIRAARGKFLAFVDADDLVPASFVSNAVAAVNEMNVDVVFGQILVRHAEAEFVWRTTGGEGPEVVSREARELLAARTLSDSPSTHSNEPFRSVPNVLAALYLRDAIEPTRFSEGVSQAEDRLFNAAILSTEITVGVVPEVWYVYDQSSAVASATRSLDGKSIASLIPTVAAYAEFGGFLPGTASGRDVPAVVRKAAASGCVNYLTVIVNLGTERKDFVATMRQVLARPGLDAALREASPERWIGRFIRFAARRRYILALWAYNRLRNQLVSRSIDRK